MLTRLYTEKIYGYTATVFHRTGVEFGKKAVDYIFKHIYTKGNGGDEYGSGLYCCYEVEDQLNKKMVNTYGQYIIKLRVNLNKFLIFDKESQIKIFGKETSLKEQSKKYGVSDTLILNFLGEMDEKLDNLKPDQLDSYVASSITQIDYNKFNGIIYKGRSDGRVAVIYNMGSYQPIAYTKAPSTIKNENELVWVSSPYDEELQNNFRLTSTGGDVYNKYSKLMFDNRKNTWVKIDRVSKTQKPLPKITDEELIDNGVYDEIDKTGTMGYKITQKNMRYGVLDKDNRVILPPIYTDISSPDEDGNRKIELGDKIGLIDFKFNILIKPLYDKIFPPNFNGYIKTKLGNKYGMYNRNYKEILYPKYTPDEFKEKMSNKDYDNR